MVCKYMYEDKSEESIFLSPLANCSATYAILDFRENCATLPIFQEMWLAFNVN